MMATTHAPSLKERQRQEREQLILRAAEELLVERGYHDMAIDDIAARVGISKGTVYLHFASKEDLVMALCERGMRAFLQALSATLATSATPGEKLRTIFERVYSAMSARRFQLFHAVFHDPSLHCRLIQTHEALRELWVEPTRRVAALIDEGKASGEFDSTIPTPVLQSLFWSMLAPQTRQSIVEQQIPLEDAVGHLTRFFFKGIAAGPADDLAATGAGRRESSPPS